MLAAGLSACDAQAGKIRGILGAVERCLETPLNHLPPTQ
ncbi:hypothetical protein NOC27_1893 [Nitrosococcus oceani AFC27]|nr:hypothetical protein NOC27_1893 [Nitrosococcus oceani AFC27]